MRAPAFAIAIIAVIALTDASGTAASGVTGDGLDRGALLAQASVYVVEADYAGRVKTGLAFAVSPGGDLLAAHHVVREDGRRPRKIVVRQAGGLGHVWTGRVVAADPGRDLALVRIPTRGAPALLLGGEGAGVAIFGRSEGALVVRKGGIGRAELAKPPVDRMVTRILVGVQLGESGGPVIDSRGRVRGMVLAFFRSSNAGLMEPASSLDRFLRDSGVTNAEGRSGAEFRRGMEALWRLEAVGAERHLRAAARTYPLHPLVDVEIASARRLAAARFELGGSDRGRGLLAALGVAAGAAALGFALALSRGSERNRLSEPYGGDGP